jgi:ADP-heptose:LPS heptosyltransferase
MKPRDPRLDPPPNLFARLAARLAAALLPLRGGQPQVAELRRILVVRSDDRVGNALLTVPLARTLAQLLPAARIDLLLSTRRGSVAQGLSGIHVIPFEKRDAFRHPLRFARTLLALRRAGYDAAIDAAHWHAFSLTGALLARWSTRRWVVGAGRGEEVLYSAAVPLPPPAVREVEAKLELLRGLGLSPPRDAPPLETGLGANPALREALRAQLRASGLAGPFIALNPGARKADHRWPARAFGALAAGLRQALGLRSVILWGPGEKALAETVRGASSGAALLAPPTDLDGLAALFREAALVVANDTGPMHLAVACGAKVLAIGLSTDADRWSHPGPLFRLVHAAGEGAVSAALAAAADLLALTPAHAQGSLRAPRRDP